MDMYKVSKLELDSIAHRMHLIAGAIRGDYPIDAVIEWTTDVLEWCQDVFDDGVARNGYNMETEPTNQT